MNATLINPIIGDYVKEADIKPRWIYLNNNTTPVGVVAASSGIGWRRAGGRGDGGGGVEVGSGGGDGGSRGGRGVEGGTGGRGGDGGSRGRGGGLRGGR